MTESHRVAAQRHVRELLGARARLSSLVERVAAPAGKGRTPRQRAAARRRRPQNHRRKNAPLRLPTRLFTRTRA